MQMKPKQEKPGSFTEPKAAQNIKMGAAESKQPDGSDTPVPLSAWLAVALLLGLNVHNQWSRALVYYLVSFKVDDTPENKNLYMNKDLNFSEEQYGVLASFGFIALYTAASLVAGRAADKLNRAAVISFAAATWSLSTAATSMATSFESVLTFRALTGVSQAFIGPQAYGLIASYFSGSGTAFANSIYASGVYVGGALASLSILLDNQLGWRDTTFLAGSVGVGLALLSAITLSDPRNTATEASTVVASRDKQQAAPPSSSSSLLPSLSQNENKGLASIDLRGTVDAVQTVLSNRFVQVLFAATAFRFCAGYGIGIWKAPFYREAFPDFTVCMCVCTHVFVYVCTCVCMCVYVYVFVYICMCVNFVSLRDDVYTYN
jgi:MFS family permease